MSTSWAPVTTGASVDGMVCPWGVTTGLEIGSPGKGLGVMLALEYWEWLPMLLCPPS